MSTLCHGLQAFCDLDNMRFSLSTLDMHWSDTSNQQQKLNIVKEGCGKWHNIGIHIEMPQGELDALNQDKHNNSDRFTEVLTYWTQTGGNLRYPATWIGLQNVFHDTELGSLAGKIQEAMPFLKL